MEKTNHSPSPATLETTLASIRRRWGVNAICKLSTTAPLAVLPTGFTALDAALGIGGLPRGRMTTLVGTATSGIMTLALRMARAAQHAGDLVAVINLSQRLDPAYISDCGLDLRQILLCLPKTETQALAILHDLVASRGIGFILFNTEATLAQQDSHQATLHRLGMALRKSSSIWVGVFHQPLGSAAPAASPLAGADLHLQIEKQGWLEAPDGSAGYATAVTIVKNKCAPTTQGSAVTLRITGL